jgi:trans-aconitate 2-methyltransferase
MGYDASDYARQSSLQKTMADKQLASLDLQGSERILDVGCGDGKITAQVAGRVPGGSVLGVDPSAEMIAFASTRFDPSSWPNLRFEMADAASLSYRHAFDLVVSFNALHWVREQGAALRSIRDALRPGGRAILRLVPAGVRKSLEDVIDEVRRSSAWAGDFSGFDRPDAHLTAENYRALAVRCGFEVDGIRVEDESWDFETRPSFAAWCRANFVAWTSRLPADASEAFIAEVLDRYSSAVTGDPAEANTFKFYQMSISLRSP